MFPVKLFDDIFDKHEEKYHLFDFGHLTWYLIRQLTLAHAVRKFHLKKDAPEEEFLTRLIKIQIIAQMRAATYRSKYNGRQGN